MTWRPRRSPNWKGNRKYLDCKYLACLGDNCDKSIQNHIAKSRNPCITYMTKGTGVGKFKLFWPVCQLHYKRVQNGASWNSTFTGLWAPEKKKKKKVTNDHQSGRRPPKKKKDQILCVYCCLFIIIIKFFFSLRAVCPIDLFDFFQLFFPSPFSSFPLFSQLSSPFVYPCRSLRQLKPLLYIDTPSLHTALGRSPSPASRRYSSHSTLRTSAIPLDDTHTPLNITLCRLCSSIASPIDCF